MKHKLPNKYIEAEEWAIHFLKRMSALKRRYDEDKCARTYFNTGTSLPERAALKRASMDLSRALAKMRKS